MACLVAAVDVRGQLQSADQECSLACLAEEVGVWRQLQPTNRECGMACLTTAVEDQGSTHPADRGCDKNCHAINLALGEGWRSNRNSPNQLSLRHGLPHCGGGFSGVIPTSQCRA
ncbi:unnamed protein product [Sphacelaria rigidula]